jgi:Asp-tRNA(Asn)/Glu-tRNA(Gln) amidotransferase A subunit family amidase
MHHLATLTATAAGRHIADGEIAPTELLEACLERIHEREGEVAAWSLIDEAGARANGLASVTPRPAPGGCAVRCTACRSGSRTSSTSPG